MKFTESNLQLSDLLFDPNNYRYQDSTDFVSADETRFHEEGVQERAYKRLKAQESLLQLKNSIRTNGFIPIERLVVRTYEHEAGKYLVLEGNRRLAALQWISDDNEAGVATTDELKATIAAIPVVIVEAADDPAFFESLMGVRHVSGISQWGGYQRAKLVVALRDNHALSSSDVADRLGMKSIEVNRRYRAFKALQQMQNDDEFSGNATTELYPVFHEAVSLPAVKDWLGWREEVGVFENVAQLKEFYKLLSPSESDESPEGDQPREPKITSYVQVRELKDILPSAEAKRVLFDPNRSFFDAVSLAKRDELTRNWSTQVAEAVGALSALSALDLQKLTGDDLDQIKKIREVADNLITLHSKLVAK